MMATSLCVALGAGLAADRLATCVGPRLAMAVAFGGAMCGFVGASVAPSLLLLIASICAVYAAVGILMAVTNPLLISYAEGAGIPTEQATAQSTSMGIIALGVALSVSPATSSALAGWLGYQQTSALAAVVVALPGLLLCLCLARGAKPTGTSQSYSAI